MSRKILTAFLLSLAFAAGISAVSSRADVTGRPHDLSLTNDRGHCINCHDLHQTKLGQGFDHNLKRANEIAVCYQCHSGALNNYSSIDPSYPNYTNLYSQYDIRGEFNQTHIHFTRYGMDGEHNKCSYCHNPHGVFNSASTTRKPKLLSAGPDVVTDTDDYCLVCHNSDTNPPHAKFSNISVGAQYRFSRTIYKQMRHSTFFRASTVTEPVPDTAHTYDDNPYGKGKDISCLTCHRPHGSPNDHMLKAPDDQNMCLACHNGSKAPSLLSFTTTGHGKSGIKRICQDCHFPHGTGQENAIKKTITDPHSGNGNTVDISGNGMNETCYACHVSASSAKYYTGKTEYTAGIHNTSPNAHNANDTSNDQAPGECDNCHNPHGKGYARMAVDQDQTLCYDCHNATTHNTQSGKDVYAAFQQMSSSHDLTKVKCINCHNVHKATQAAYLMNPYSTTAVISDKKTFCLRCHSGRMPSGVTGALNVYTTWTNKGHDKTHVLVCDDCHDSHGSPNKKTLNYLPKSYNGKTANFVRGLSFNSRALCEACHNRTSLGYKDAKVIPTGTGYMDQHNQTDTTPCSNCHTLKHNPSIGSIYTTSCLDCHTQGTGNPYPNTNAEFNTPAITTDANTKRSAHKINYAPPSTVDCTICHGSNHETDHSPTSKVVDPDPTHPISGSLDYNVSSGFCLQCHDSTPVSIGGYTPLNILDTYTAAGHGARNAGVICSKCHTHHGSVNDKLLKTVINGSAVLANYSGNNASVCAACHMITDPSLPAWPGYRVYTGSIHAFGNRTTGNLVQDGLHGPGACVNCHNPHGNRVEGRLQDSMLYKNGENLCYRCHASGFDNFSTPGDYNNKWSRFGTLISIKKEGGALHYGYNSFAAGAVISDGVESLNSFADKDCTITAKIKIKALTTSTAGGGAQLGFWVFDTKDSSNYTRLFYRGHSVPQAYVVRYPNDGGAGTVINAFGDEASNYHTFKLIRRKSAGMVDAYIDNTFVRTSPLSTSGYFKIQLICGISNSVDATPETVEAYFKDFNVNYNDCTTPTRNTASGDDVQARFYMKSHHKISDADQADGSKVECFDCHDPHTVTEAKMAYKNVSGNIKPIEADQNFCLKCHSANPPQDVKFPQGGVWDKSAYDSSAHGNPLKRYKGFGNYSNGVAIACRVCHNPHGSDQAHLQRESWDINRDGIPDDIDGDGILDSADKVGFVGYSTWTRKVMYVKTITGIPSRSAFKRVSTTIPYQANGSIDINLCLNCHDGSPAPNVKKDFDKPYHHDVTYADQVNDGGTKIECYDCHDQHRAQARNDAAGEYPTTNPDSPREPMAGDAKFCLRCHDNSLPPGVSFGSRQLKNIKLSYNPNDLKDSKGYDLVTSYQGHFVQATGAPMMCRVCHNQHGSNYPKMLRDDTEPSKPDYDPSQPIQGMQSVALRPTDAFSGGDSKPLSSSTERCLACHSGGTTFNGNLLPIPPPPDAASRNFELSSVGKHPDMQPWVTAANNQVNGHIYSNAFAIITTPGSVKDACTMCHDSHNPYIPTVDDELLDCYRCHNANTSLPDEQTVFNANPLNANHSKSMHPVKYDTTQPSGVECLKCHDQAKHMQGRVRLRKDPGHFVDSVTHKMINYTSESMVWTSQPTSGGYVTDTTLKFTNNSTMNLFCIECHDPNSTVASGFSGGGTEHAPPKLPAGYANSAHFTDGQKVCTDCHEHHGSVNTMLKKNTLSDQSSAFCYGCHSNPANSMDRVDVQFQFMSTASHHKVNVSEQAADGKPASGSKLACKNCHNPHLVTRTQPVVYGNHTSTLANVDANFCISCHSSSGAPGVKFPGYTTGGSGQEWDSVTGKWNKWNKQAYTSSPHSAPGGINCRNCHNPHGGSNYALLLKNISSSSGKGTNITVTFGKRSTARGGKRTDEIGVNSVCAACHKAAMNTVLGNVTSITYPGYASYTALTFGRKAGLDKNCTYCHNPHGTSQTKFQNDTSPVARMMRSNKPLYMNMTSSNYGSVYNFKPRGFANSTTGAPYYMFCSSRGCHASEKTAANTFVTATEQGKPLYDTFSMDLPLDNFNKYATKSSHHPLKEGVINCTSCHKEHGASTKATDYVSPDLRAQYFPSSYWPKLWHGGIGLYETPPQTPGYYNGDHGKDNSWGDIYMDGGAYFNGANYFEASAAAAWGWNSARTPLMTNMNKLTTVVPPGNANDLCFMCHQKRDIIGNYTTGMVGTNTRFLGHEAVAGGAKISHQISPDTAIPASGEYHNFSCSTCHFPHATTQNRLVKVSCLSQLDSEAPQTGTENGATATGSMAASWSPKEASIFKCHAYTTYRHGTGGTAYRGWRNLTTSAKTDFQRPHNAVTDLSATVDATQTDQNMNVNLAWKAVTDDQTGLGADHYNVYRSTQYIKQDTMSSAVRVLRGANGSGGSTGQSMTATDKTGQPNTNCWYVVVACDAQNNESFISNCIHVTLGADNVPPNAISTQQLSQPPGTTNAVIAWQDPKDNINVTSYKIYRQTGVSSITDVSQATYLNTVTEPSTGLSADGTSDTDTYSYTDTTLTATNIGTQYAYAVVAFDAANNPITNAVINSYLTTGVAPLNITIVDPAPAVVTTLTAVPVSKVQQASLSWTAPSNVGVIDHYNVYRDTQVSMATKTLVTPSGTTTTAYTDTVPLTATNYYYAVTAVDQTSNKESSLGNVFGPINIPAAPTALSSSLGSNSQVTLTWTAPAYSTGLSSYKVYKRLNGGSWILASTVTTTNAPLSFTGLEPGSYDFCVASVYGTYEGVSSYESLPSNTTNRSIVDTVVPSSFTLTGSLSGDHTQATINWNAPADSNYTGYSASLVDHYVITSSYDNGATWGTLTTTYRPAGYNVSGTPQSYTDPATQPVGGSVIYHVQAVDAQNNYSATATVTINLGPKSITDLNVAGSTSTTANILNWGPPSNLSGVALSSYKVYAKEQGSALASLTGATQIGTVTANYTSNPGNIALQSAGATASSTTTYTGSPTYTNDGNAGGSYWGGNWGTGATDYLTLTWGTAKTIESVSFYFYSNTYYTPKNFLIQTWNGSAWVTQVTVTNNASTNPTYYFPVPVSTTKVQLVITETGGGIASGYYPIVYEFYAYVGETFSHTPSNVYLPAQVGHTYAYAVIAYDTSGLNSPISTGTTTVKTVVDADAPATVSNLALSLVPGTSNVNLSWSMPTDNVGATQFRVYRLPTNCAGTPAAVTSSNYNTALPVYTGSYGSNTPGNTITYTDTTMCDGAGAYYAVSSLDAAGNWSAVSNSPYISERPTAVNLSVASSATTSANILTFGPSTSRAGLSNYKMYVKEQSTALTSVTGATLMATITTNLSSSQTFTHDVNNALLPALVGHTYAYAVIARDVNGLDSVISNGSVLTVADKDVPGKVTDLEITTAIGTNQATLTWSTPPDNLGLGIGTGAVNYAVYRLPTGSTGTAIPVTDDNFRTASLVYVGSYTSSVAGTPNSFSTTWYDHVGAYYAVRSLDNSGNESPISNSPYIVVGKDVQAPTPPVIQSCTPKVSPEVVVAWSPAVDNVCDICGVNGYRLFRADVNVEPFLTDKCITENNIGQAQVVFDLIPYNYITISDTGGTPGKTYYYALRAWDNENNLSNISNCAIATVATTAVDTTPPTWTGTPLSVTQQPYPDIDLNWTLATDIDNSSSPGTVDHYDVYRSPTTFSSKTDPGVTKIATVSGIRNSYIDKSGAHNTTYFYGIVAVDASTNHNASALSNIGSATVAVAPSPDNTKPTVPGTLSATTGVYPYINLNWTQSTDVDDAANPQPLLYYKLYRADYPADVTDANKDNPSLVQTFIIAHDAAVYASTGAGSAVYNYRLEAFDLAGNSSGLSNEVTGTVASAPCVDTTAPTAPASLAAIVGPSPDMALSWTASTDSGCTVSVIDHYNLYKATYTITASTDLRTITPLAVAGNSVTFTDSSGAPNTTYWYVLTAVDPSGNESGKSNIITKTTAADTMAPAAITDLKASSSAGQVQLTWCKPSDNVGVNHYDIYMHEQGTILTDADIKTDNKVATYTNTGTCLSYNDTGRTSGHTYSYAVIAVDGAGNRATISRGQAAGDTIATLP